MGEKFKQISFQPSNIENYENTYFELKFLENCLNLV